MRTTTPFQQLLISEIERIRSMATPRMTMPYPNAPFAAPSSRYTIGSMRSRAKSRKGFLARVLGN